MNTSTLIYTIATYSNIIATFQVLTMIAAILLMFWVVIYFLETHTNPRADIPKPRRKYVVILLICSVISVLVPSKDTVYTMIAADKAVELNLDTKLVNKLINFLNEE